MMRHTYTLFYAMKEDIMHYFTLDTINKKSEGAATELAQKVMQNEDVLFQWCLLTPEFDDAVGKAVLQKITDLYVTTRGFAFTSSCLELYKQVKGKALQRSKGIRKEILCQKYNSMEHVSTLTYSIC